MNIDTTDLPEETDEDRHRNSRKREITATVVTTLTVIIATGLASGLIDKFGKKVHDTIAPPAKTDEEN
jgi:hypothetical protein